MNSKGAILRKLRPILPAITGNSRTTVYQFIDQFFVQDLSCRRFRVFILLCQKRVCAWVLDIQAAFINQKIKECLGLRIAQMASGFSNVGIKGTISSGVIDSTERPSKYALMWLKNRL
jgi:hypothetical protein